MISFKKVIPILCLTAVLFLPLITCQEETDGAEGIPDAYILFAYKREVAISSPADLDMNSDAGGQLLPAVIPPDADNASQLPDDMPELWRVPLKTTDSNQSTYSCVDCDHEIDGSGDGPFSDTTSLVELVPDKPKAAVDAPDGPTSTSETLFSAGPRLHVQYPTLPDPYEMLYMQRKEADTDYAPWTWSLPVPTSSNGISGASDPAISDNSSFVACGASFCGKNQKCEVQSGDLERPVEWSCHCDQGFTQLPRKDGPFAKVCVCPASKFTTEDGKCLEANRVYRLLLPLTSNQSLADSGLLQWNSSGEVQLSQMQVQTAQETFDHAMEGKNLTSQVSCLFPVKGDDTDYSPLTTVTCFFKFRSSPQLFSTLPTQEEVRDIFDILLLQGVLLNATSMGLTGIHADGQNVSVSEYDYCREGEHNCDVRTTRCLFQPWIADISCPCLPFHSKRNNVSCRYDTQLWDAYLDLMARHNMRLWLGLYILISLLALSLVGLIGAVLLLKTRPFKTVREDEKVANRMAKVSITRYHNRLPRVTLDVTGIPHFSTEMDLAMQSTSMGTAAQAIPSDQRARLSAAPAVPAVPPPVVYSAPVKSGVSGGNERLTTAQMAPQGMTSFQRVHRLTGQEHIPMTSSEDKGHFRAPLASSESSMDMPTTQSNNSTLDRCAIISRPAKDVKTLAFPHGVRLSGRNAPQGTIYSMEDAAALQEAVQHHRNSALLRLMHSQQSIV